MSSLKEQLLDFYTRVLQSTGVVVTDDGLVMTDGVGDTAIPVTVTNNEVLCLPTEERLRSGAWEGLQPFHPVSENALRGESVVLKKMRILVASELTTVLCNAMELLTLIAADTTLHAKLSPKASEFLDYAKKADEKTLKRLKQVLDKVSLTGDHRLLSFYFGRPGGQKKDSYTRTCRVDFPILDEFQIKEPTVFGVKMRHDDKATIKGIFSWLLDLDQDGEGVDPTVLMDQYGTGTHSLTVPYFYTLMKSYAKVAKQLNGKLKLFKKSHPEQVKDMTIDVSWEAELEDLAKFRDVIPALKGNEGVTAAHPGKRGAEAVVSNDQPLAPPPVRRNVGINSSVGSPVAETPTVADVVAPPVTAAPTTVPAPASITPPPTQQPAVKEGLLSWSALNANNQVAASYSGPSPFGAPTMMAPQQTLVNPNARDLARVQAYNQYQQSPHAYYNPAVHNSVMQSAPVAPRYVSAPVSPVQSPNPGPKLPSRW